MYTTTETIRMHVFSTPFHGCGNDRNASFMELAFGCLGLDPEPPPFFPPSCEKQELARNATRWARRSARAQKKGERRSFGSKPKGPNATFIELALRFFPHPENVPDHVTLRWREGGVSPFWGHATFFPESLEKSKPPADTVQSSLRSRAFHPFLRICLQPHRVFQYSLISMLIFGRFRAPLAQKNPGHFFESWS